jgi:hypothetical protein
MFREANPNGSIKTEHQFLENGDIVFTAYVLKDKAKPESGDATGHSYGKLAGQKQFEKLETISIGRALAILGYLGSGEIASSEEMEEFNDWKETQTTQMLNDAREKLEDAKNLKELGEAWAVIPAEAKLKLSEVKDSLKLKLESKDENPKV